MPIFFDNIIPETEGIFKPFPLNPNGLLDF